MNYLPLHCIVAIAKHLRKTAGVKEVVNVASICKKFHEIIAKTPDIWENVYYTPMTEHIFDDLPSISFPINIIYSQTKNVNRHIPEIYNMLSEYTNIIQYCGYILKNSNIWNMVIHGFNQDENAFHRLLANIPSPLRQIEFHDCQLYDASNFVLSLLFKTLTSLQNVIFYNCTFSDECLIFLSDTLISIKLFNCNYITDKAIAILATLPNLESVIISKCNNITEKSKSIGLKSIGLKLIIY